MLNEKYEVDMVKKTLSEHSADEKLAVCVSRALDKSLDDIDELRLQRLKNARVHALNQSHDQSSGAARKWISLRVAASVAVLLLIPVAMHQDLFNSSGDQDLEVVVQEVPYSTEEMDDIEMLMALEDSDA